ncbi:hypothetical protein Tco_0243494 [Tanacetum coccineum]
MSQQRKTMCTYMKNMAGYKMEHFKGKSFYEVKEMFDNVYKQVTSFVPIEEESSKRQKTGEGSEPTEELKADEISQEDLQQMIMVVPMEEVYVETLQKFDKDDLDMQWSLVKERLSSTYPNDDKERKLWVELKRLFEHDIDDILWKLQRYMHDPLVWKVYDTCGVHHVSSLRGHDIFMLVKKDYPLTRGILTLMLANKLQVDEYSKMANKLLRKIFILANRPRQKGVECWELEDLHLYAAGSSFYCWMKKLMLLKIRENSWVDGNGSNPGGGFGKPGGGRETRGGGDGLEGPGGQLSMVGVATILNGAELVERISLSRKGSERVLSFGCSSLEDSCDELVRYVMENVEENVRKMVFEDDDYKEKVVI